VIAAAERILEGASPLTPTLLPQLQQLIAATGERLSEYSAANLYLYRGRHHYRFHSEPAPHVTGRTYDGVRHALPLALLDRDGAEALLDAVDCIGPVGDPALAARLGLALGWNDDDSDYVYAAERLAILDGAKAKRSQARAFEEEEVRPRLLPIDPDDIGDALTVLAGWSEDVGKGEGDTDLAECREALALMAPLGLEGWLVEIAGAAPVAFLLAGRGADGSHIVHFAKGRRAYAGAYPWMFARFAARVGTGWINFEQDLGKPGFAQAKRAFAPAQRLRKYRLRRDG